jgi:hypothetical protein
MMADNRQQRRAHQPPARRVRVRFLAESILIAEGNKTHSRGPSEQAQRTSDAPGNAAQGQANPVKGSTFARKQNANARLAPARFL